MTKNERSTFCHVLDLQLCREESFYVQTRCEL
jgi:hypothetical protein